MTRHSQTIQNGIPEDWKEMSIGEITVRARQRDPRRNPAEPFLYVDVSSVSNSSFRIVQTAEMLGAAAPSRARKEIHVDDILFATVRPTLKRVAIVPPQLDGQIASTGFNVLRPERAKLEPRYLYYRLLTREFIQRMGELQRGASYPAVRDTDVLNERIPVPPLGEQRKIADLLGLVQRSIDQQERLLTLTTELKKALLHRLFNHGVRNEPQKQTELGPIPQSWNVVKLVDLFGIKHGFAFDGEYFKESGENTLLTPGHFHEGGGFRDQGTKTKYYTGEIPSGYLLEEGDLLVAMTEQKSGLLGSSALIPSKGKFLHNQRLGLIVDLQEVRLDKLFLSYLFNTTRVRIEIAKTSSGSKVRHTSPGKILDIKIALPPLTEQQDIAATLQAVDAKLDLVKRKNAALNTLFHTLLQELMTTRIRVDQLDLEDSAIPPKL